MFSRRNVHRRESRGRRRRLMTGADRPAGRRAFTLLEVLVTAVLLVSILAGIWGIYRMFGSLYETGYVETERAQMIRSLTQQLSDDLAATVMPPPKSKRRPARYSLWDGSSSSDDAQDVPSLADRVGLLGTYNSLRLDIVQTIAPRHSAPPGQDPLASSLGFDATSNREFQSELVTVLYSFQPPPTFERDPTADPVQLAYPGLLRQEFRLDEPLAAAQLSTGNAGLPVGTPPLTGGHNLPSRTAGAPLSDEQMQAEILARSTTMYMPEVIALEFRYYDGRDWTDAWDSRSRRALPLAVEVTLQIEDPTDKERSANSTKTGASDSGRSLVETADAAAGPQPAQPLTQDGYLAETLLEADQPPSYRFVVRLPQASANQRRRPAQSNGAGAAGIEDVEPDLLQDEPELDGSSSEEESP